MLRIKEIAKKTTLVRRQTLEVVATISMHLACNFLFHITNMHFHSVTHNFIGAHQVVVCKSKCSHENRFSYETAAHVVYCAVHVLMRAFFYWDRFEPLER